MLAVTRCVFQALATLPKQPAVKGDPGASVQQIIAAIKVSESTVRRALRNLVTDKRCLVTGTMTKQAKLYGVNEQ